MKVFKITDTAKLPTKDEGNMCYDLYANIDHEIMVHSGEVTRIPTGIKIALPFGYHASIRSRSGLAAKHGVQILGGQIDGNYRGEWIVLMTTEPNMPLLVIKPGDRIAQFKIELDITAQVEEVFSEEELGTTDRGEKGFGSSGR
jgi:dUTP pyrophosphatase